MHEASFEEGLELILAQDSRYPRDAYLFIREALDHTQKAVLQKAVLGERRQSPHVTGQELLAGIRDFSLAQFGPMAITVLQEWGINKGEDFGEIVFNMVEAGLLAKTEKDSREDFRGGYDFDDAFRKPFLPESKKPRESKSAV